MAFGRIKTPASLMETLYVKGVDLGNKAEDKKNVAASLQAQAQNLTSEAVVHTKHQKAVVAAYDLLTEAGVE